jgi:hypothetical protein
VQVTGDEIWISFMNVETTKQWMRTCSTNKLKKFKETFARGLMASLLWDRKGLLWWNSCNKGPQ